MKRNVYGHELEWEYCTYCSHVLLVVFHLKFPFGREIYFPFYFHRRSILIRILRMIFTAASGDLLWIRTNEMNEKQKQPASHGIQFYFCAFVSMVSAMHFVWPDMPKTYASHMFPFEPNAIITQKCYRRFDKDGDTDSEQTVHLCSVISWEAQCYKCGQRIALRRLILSGSVVFRWTQCFNYRFAFSFSSENCICIFLCLSFTNENINAFRLKINGKCK